MVDDKSWSESSISHWQRTQTRAHTHTGRVSDWREMIITVTLMLLLCQFPWKHILGEGAHFSVRGNDWLMLITRSSTCRSPHRTNTHKRRHAYRRCSQRLREAGLVMLQDFCVLWRPWKLLDEFPPRAGILPCILWLREEATSGVMIYAWGMH